MSDINEIISYRKLMESTSVFLGEQHSKSSPDVSLFLECELFMLILDLDCWHQKAPFVKDEMFLVSFPFLQAVFRALWAFAGVFDQAQKTLMMSKTRN